MTRLSTMIGGGMVLAALSGVASAQGANESGWYAGIDLARSRVGLGGDIGDALGRQGIGASVAADRHDGVLGANLGYQVNRNFAVEGAITQLGRYSYTATAATPGADSITGSYRSTAYSVAGVGTLPIANDWSLYGKAGLAYSRTRLSAASSTGATAPSSQSDSSAGLVFGAGVKYDINRQVFAKAGWDRYADVGSENVGKADVDLLSVGVGLRF